MTAGTDELDYQALFVHAPGLYMVLEPNAPRFTILEATNAYLAATLTKRASMVGRGLFEVFPDDPNDPHATGTSNLRASLERAIASRAPDTMAVQKYPVQRPESEGGGFEERFWSVVNTPVLDARGGVRFVIHRAVDVTDLVLARRSSEEHVERTRAMELEVLARSQELDAANNELRGANERLSELDKAKTVFFSNISHEFRTPLTLMLGPVEDCLADRQAPLPPRARERLELVHHNTLRLLKLVNRLLDFSRIEAGRMTATFAPTDLAAFTTELASMFQSAAVKAGLTLEIDCPPLTEPALADRDLWEKIVLNLLSNAFKFTFAGRIAVKLEEQGRELVLRVSDTGTGIPADQLALIFERFHRVEGARGRTHEGTGIGLALVQDLVRLHGGTISVESAVDVGSTFTVTIPRAATAPSSAGPDVGLADPSGERAIFAAEAHGWVAAPETEARAPASTGRILFADDNAELRVYVSGLLAPTYAVEVVADGRQALARARESRPDLVLSDVMMPELDGFGLLRELRADPSTRDIPVILLSARAGEEAAIEGLDASADDYLAKPFSARELLARVRTHVELARDRRVWLRDLERANTELALANKELEAFSYSVSHDLRAPLRAIDGFSKLLLDRCGDAVDEEGRHYLERVRAGTTRMAALIDDLLELSRITRATLRDEPVDLSAMARAIVEELRRRDPQRVVTVEIAPGLSVRGDRRLLAIALENLLGNAWKFTGKRAAASVWFGREAAAEGTAFFVRDDGAGFDMAFAGKLFAPFQRLHRASEFDGTGIGLATVQRVVARHGGRIWARGAVDEGATFYFTIGET
jgi:signal transduction histidine kinase